MKRMLFLPATLSSMSRQRIVSAVPLPNLSVVKMEVWGGYICTIPSMDARIKGLMMELREYAFDVGGVE